MIIASHRRPEKDNALDICSRSLTGAFHKFVNDVCRNHSILTCRALKLPTAARPPPPPTPPPPPPPPKPPPRPPNVLEKRIQNKMLRKGVARMIRKMMIRRMIPPNEMPELGCRTLRVGARGWALDS